MFTRKTAHQIALDVTIEALLKDLDGRPASDAEYSKIVDQLAALYKIRYEKTDAISKDTLAMILGNLAGILIIIRHEHINVITSKALAFAGKLR